MVNYSFIRQGKKGMLKLVTFCAFLCTMSLQGMAQDNALKISSEDTQWKADDFGFNAIDLHQTRFLYGDSVQYRNKKFYDNLSVGLVWRLDKIHDRTSPGYWPELSKSVYIGKEINKLHSLHLIFSQGKYDRMPNENDPTRKYPLMEKYQAELLYSFNWTRYFGGYNPYRKVEAVTNLGLGAFRSDTLGTKKEWGAMFIVGAGVRMQLSPTISVGVDPYVALVSDKVDLSESFRGYDVAYGADVSLAYTFHERSFKDEVRSRFAGKTFVDFGLGAQFLLKSQYNSGLNFLSSADPALKLGVGYWFSPGFALRATANLSSNNLESASGARFKNVLAGGRLDALFNPYHHFTDHEPHRFDVNAIVGWEYGKMAKTGHLSTQYDGLSGGLQFRYNYDKNVSLYVEPRVTIAGYDVTPRNDESNYARDYLFSMTAGLEYAVNEYSFLGKKQQPSKFNPHISFSLLGGSNYLFIAQNQDAPGGYSLGLAGEMQITPYSGVRVMGDYSYLSHASGLNMVNLSADYVFDLGTLLQGYDKSNRWDVALAAGPVLSGKVGEFDKKYADSGWGFQVGIPVSYRLAPRLELLFEPRARFFDILGGRDVAADYIPNAYTAFASNILNTQLGLRYSLNDHFYVAKDSLHERFKAEPGRLFAHMGVGAQAGADFYMAPRVEAGLGYWFNPGVATRASIILGSHELNDAELPSLRQMSASGRLDLILDPFGYLANRYDRPFGFNFIGGWEYGKMFRGFSQGRWGSHYHALSAGVQLRYNYDGYHTLYLEPRYTSYRALGNGVPQGEEAYKNGGYLSLVAGMELGATDYAFHSNKQQPGEFTPTYSFALLGGPGYVYGAYTRNPVSEASVGLATEYKYSPYSGVRLTANYSNYRGKDGSPVKKGYVNFGVDYVFDIATLLQGYTDDRKWNAALALGPTVGLSSGSNKWGVGGQMGIPVSYSFNDSWAVMFEPRGKVYHKYLFGSRLFMQYEALLGMKYTIDKESFEDYARGVGEDFADYVRDTQKDKGTRFFTDFGFGAQAPFKSGLSAGPRATASLGYWLTSDFALRGSLLFSSYNWYDRVSSGEEFNQNVATGAARLDLMVNPLNFFMGRSYRKFDINALAGWEFGPSARSGFGGLSMYNGWSTGLQLLYNESSSHSLYVEPRFVHSVSGDVKENLWALTGGIYFTSSEYALRSKARQPEVFVPTLSVSLSGGLEMPIRPTAYGDAFVAGFTPGITGEYRFGPYSGVRLGLNHGSVLGRVRANRGGGLVDSRAKSLALSADYLFDFTTLLRGYTTDREWDVNLALGPVVGWDLVSKDRDFGAQLSVPVTYNINNRFGILFEPRARAFVRDYLKYSSIDWNSGLSPLQISAQLGVKYTIDKDSFEDYARGFGGDLADYVRDTQKDKGTRFFTDFGLGLVKPFESGLSAGPRATASLGYWLNSDFALRGSLLFSSYSWNNGVGYSQNTAAGAGRVDLMVNPLNFFMGRSYRKFDINALAGWEFGADFRFRENALGLKRKLKATNGASLGLQLLYNQSPSHSLYLEPRWVHSVSDVKEDLFALTGGVYFTASDYALRSKARQPERFVPTFSLAFSGGVDVPIRPTEFAGTFMSDLATGVTGEYRFGPYSGLRMALNHSTFSNSAYDKGGMVEHQAGYLSVSADYLFDFTTLLQGYTTDRKWDVGVAFGPVYSKKVSSYASAVAKPLGVSKTWGVQLSVPVTYNVNERFGIMLEPRGRAFAAGVNSLRSSKSDRIVPPLSVNTQLGLKYTLGHRDHAELQEETVSRDFASFAMGMQFMRNVEGVAPNRLGGVQLGFGMGRWVSPLWGVRLSGEFAASNYLYLEQKNALLKTARLGARMDMLLNPLALKDNYVPTRWEVALLAGYECGVAVDKRFQNSYFNDRRTYNGLSVGAQLRYNTNEHNVLYLEPRFSCGEKYASLTAGMEFSMTENRFHSSKNQVEEFKPYFSLALMSGVKHKLSFVTSKDAAASVVFNGFSLSGEYHFTPYSGARLTYAYSQRSNVGFDYMFDLSTLLAGYTSDRRLDVSLAAGPVFSKLAKNSKKTAAGVQLAIPVQYHINENWGVSLEPQAQMFKWNSASKNVNLQMGVKYTF